MRGIRRIGIRGIKMNPLRQSSARRVKRIGEE